MNFTIKEFSAAYLKDTIEIWNRVVRDGVAFPQLDELDEATGAAFFAEQSFVGIAVDETDHAIGLYILHPNNIGRCGHICNTSYAVRADLRGLHIGEKLVLHSLAKGKELGFRILQFNAVVASNTHALNLYKRLGFIQLGIIPGGFRMPDGRYEDIVPHYREL